MQETKNKYLFILLVCLTITTAVVFWLIRPQTRLDVDQQLFQLSDFKMINKIELESDSGVVTLAFDGTRWRVNDRFDADENMIKVLFATLQQARPKRAVGKDSQDSIYRRVKEAGIKVSLFEGGELRKQFLAGGNRAKTQAYFGGLASEEIFVMTIPGYRVYVSGIFEMKENGWRDKYVFGFNWRNFKNLQANFPQSPSENFFIAMDKGYFGIPDISEADTARINTFLDHVSLLTVDQYLTEPVLRDSLLKVKPFMQFVVTDIGSRTYGLRLFLAGKQSLALGIIQDSQVAVFNRRKILPLLMTKSFFRKK